MRYWTTWRRVLAVAFAGALAAPAQVAEASRPTRTRVVILGASVSAGFSSDIVYGAQGDRNRTFKLAAVLRKAWPRDRVLISDYSKVDLFLRPAELGPKLVARAVKKRPDLVIAVDFAFWFGAGSPRGTATLAWRLARQKVALDLLGRFDCPILLGDYPDMTGADPRICPARMIPSKAELTALNKRLRDWAGEHPNVRLFALGAWVAAVKAGTYRMVVGGHPLVLKAGALLQTDRLHATRLGATLLAARVLGHVAKMLPTGSALGRGLPGPGELIAAMGVEDALPRPVGK